MSLQLYEEPLADRLKHLRSKELTPTEYYTKLRERTEAIEHKIGSLVDEPDWDRLETQAEELGDPDELPLYGIPIGIKDVIRADGLPTKANSDVPPEALAGPEASSVTRLREAGCLVFAKTVTTQFAFSNVGSTHNPHKLGHTSGGSSSGSAAAVAAGLCPLALGTQTGGSHIRPAAFCGIFGFKSTFQRVPTDSVLQVSASLDHVGIHTQDMAGMQAAAAVMCDDWDDDVDTPEDPTLGVPTGPYLDQIREEGEAAFAAHREALKQAGYEVVEVELFDDIDEQKDRHGTLSTAEGALAHHERFEAYANGYSEQLVERIETGRAETVEALARSRAYQSEFTANIKETMETEGIDAWVCPPALGTAPEGVDYTGDASMNRPWTMAGMPAMSLPGGFVDGLPVGLQIVAARGADEHLLNWAEEISPVVADSI